MTAISESSNTAPSQQSDAAGEKQKAGNIDDSVAKVVSAISGQQVNSADIKNQQISEDVMYAALVHQKLEESNPESAKALLERLPRRFNKVMENRARQPLFKAVDTILNREIKRGNLQRRDKARIVRSSFAEAQIDGQKRKLANRTDNGRSVAGSEVSDVQARNEGKSAARKTMVKFRNRLQTNPEMTDRMYQHLSTRFDNLKKASDGAGSRPQDDTSTSSTAASSTTTSTNSTTASSGASDYDPSVLNTSKYEFVYNPAAKETGNVQILLPIAYSENVRAVAIFSGGEQVAELTFDKIGEDGRAIWNYDKPGDSLPDNAEVRMVFQDGSSLPYNIGNPAELYRRAVNAPGKN